MERNLNNSRPLDVHRWSDHPEVHPLIDELWTACFSDFDTDTGIAGRRPKGHPKRQLKVLILDLYVAWVQDPALSIGVSMTNSGYYPNSRYNALHISKVLIPLIHRAHQTGLIGFAPGSEYAGRISRVWAEQPLIDLFRRSRFGVLDIAPYREQETIVLSMGKGHWIDYQDTSPIIQARRQIEDYNELLHLTFVDVPSLNFPNIQVPSKEDGKRPASLRISQGDKFSRRVFYRGSWDLGGRIHGGFWQSMPKVWRSQLFIDDLPTIEDDYSGLHIALLYGLEGALLHGDAYTLDLPSKFGAEETRHLVKGLALMAINASSEAKAFQAFRQDQHVGSPLKRLTNKELSVVLNAFKAKHPAIAQYMCSDQGVHLMAIDGRIATRIIDQFTQEKVPVLNLFDSYIVDAFHAPELRSAMIAAMDAEVPGASTSFKRIGTGYDKFLTKAGDYVEELLRLPQRLLAGVVKTEGYRARRDEFLSWRSDQPEWDRETYVQGGVDQFIGSMWST